MLIGINSTPLQLSRPTPRVKVYVPWAENSLAESPTDGLPHTRRRRAPEFGEDERAETR
jgi:hypothetical protein